MSFHTILHLTQDQIHMLRMVVGTGSIARASAALELQASTISKAIQRLEHKLGAPLFKRYGKGVEPTRAGTLLLEHAMLISNQSRIVSEKIRSTQEDEVKNDSSAEVHHQFVVGIGSELGERVIGAAFTDLQHALAGPVALGVHPGSTIEEQVISGLIDVGLLCDAQARLDLHCAKIAHEAMFLAFGPSLVNDADAITPRLHALTGVPMLLPGWEHSARRFVEQSARRAGLSMRVVAEIADLSALKSLLRQGLGYTILPKSTIAEDVARGQLCATPLLGVGSKITISLICRAGAQDRTAICDASAALANCVRNVPGFSRPLPAHP